VPFLLLVLIAGSSSVGLLACLVGVEAGVLVRIDWVVARWAHVRVSGFSEAAMHGITLLGETAVVAALVVAVAAVEWVWAGSSRGALFLVGVVAGDGLVTLAVKALVHRARPPFEPVAATLGPAFPSGHSSLAAAFFAAGALLLSRGRTRRATAALGAAAVAIAAAVATSRVFLDVHWVSDVVAGVGLGWAWFALCALAFGATFRTGWPA
jgi:membrane-associated phospholipid phosphatase